jgi:2,3-bisphosphoglycerate-independent phosphoglycerate mutase
MCNARIQSSKAREILLKNKVASNRRDHQKNTSNLIYERGSKRKQEITDLESLDYAYVIAPNKIDEDRKANLIKSIFKSLPLARFRKCLPFRATVL